MEQWKAITGFPLYEVSSEGRVRSWKKNRHGRAALPHALVLQLSRNTENGRWVAHLWHENNRRAAPVHRLVLETFVGPCPEGMEACHNDGNRNNNSLENLRWDTHSANLMDRREHGTAPIGDKHWTARR